MPGSATLRAAPVPVVATWSDPRVRECALANGQRGIQAGAAFAAGEVIGFYGGVPVRYRRGPGGAISDPDAACNAVQVAADDRYVYALIPPPGTPLHGIDFINHSCEPNVAARGQVVLVATRRIAAGEPLTADYRAWDFVPYGEQCWCPVPKCII